MVQRAKGWDVRVAGIPGNCSDNSLGEGDPDRDGTPLSTEPLEVAFCVYRGNPTCGGQGVYTRHLTSHLVKIGHHVTVFAGQPYPRLDDGVQLVRIPSLDLYREPTPFRRPRLREIESVTDIIELTTMWTGGFPEPRTFSTRFRAELLRQPRNFDIIHDDQSLGSAIARLQKDGWPVVASVHHPVTIDRHLDMMHADSCLEKIGLRRWYSFAKMQAKVARGLDHVLTVSESSAVDIVSHLQLDRSRISVVPLGVDPDVYRPIPGTLRVPGRIMTTASSDVALKGQSVLLEALAKLRAKRREVHLVVVGQPREGGAASEMLDRPELSGAVAFVGGESDEQIVTRYATAMVAVVPSLYEGFSLPAIEAMVCGVPIVATTGGALPEVVGLDNETGLLVPPGDPAALAAALERLLDNSELANRIGQAGRKRVLSKFTWQRAAEATTEVYQAVLDRPRQGRLRMEKSR